MSLLSSSLPHATTEAKEVPIGRESVITGSSLGYSLHGVWESFLEVLKGPCNVQARTWAS